MPEPRPMPARRSLLGDLGIVWSRRKQVWKLLRREDKLGFFSAVIVTGFVAYIQVQIAVLIGAFFNRVLKMTGQPGAQTDFVEKALALLAGLYVLKESLQLLRRWLVTRTGSRIEGDMTVRVVGHLLRIDLGALAAERIGALHGRISRSVEGFVKFLKVAFADFIPAIATALYALYTGLRTDWRVGLVMLGVVPASILITIWQTNSQKGVRIQLQRAKEGLDGTVVEQLGGIEYIRAADTHALEVSRIEAAAASRGSREMKRGFALARFDWLKAINEGLFHIAIVGFAIVLAAHGQLEYGQVFTFSLLYLSIMGPMKNLHRTLDDARESTMQVTVLLEM